MARKDYNQNFNFHDWEILTLEISHFGAKRDLLIGLKSEDGQLAKLSFKNIYFLLCSEFSRQNIVSGIEVIPLDKISKTQLIQRFDEISLKKSVLNLDVDQLPKGFFVDIVSSVGAQISLICESIDA